MWFARAAKGTSLGRKIATARWNFTKRAGYCTTGSRIRLALHDLGFGRVLPRLRVRLKGPRVDIWLRPGTSDVAVFSQVWEHGQYDLPLESAPTSIIDAGANIGLASIFFALTYPRPALLLSNPNRVTLALLERNTAPSRTSSRSERHSAWTTSPIWGKTSTPSKSEKVVTPAKTDLLGQVTEGVTVPEICQSDNWTRVGLLKLDIEGGELDVLNASGSWIEATDVLAVELHEHIRPGCKETFEQAVARFPIRVSRGELDVASRVEVVV
jgi:FkbM family methyltransferase